MNNSNAVAAPQKPKFSVAISTDKYRKLINNTLGDPNRARRFVAAISSAVAVNPALQECEAGSILSGALLGESLNLSPSPQLGQYYLVPFKARRRKTVKDVLFHPNVPKHSLSSGIRDIFSLQSEAVSTLKSM